MTMARLPILLLGLLLAVPGAGPAAEDYARREAELKALREQIAQIQQQLERERDRQDAVQQELAALDRQIGASARRLRELRDQRGALEAEVARLRDAVQAQERSLSQQRQYLARQLRAAYVSGQQEYLKLLLNQQDPSQFQRVLVYYDYFSRARSERIRDAVEGLQTLARTRTDLDRRLAELGRLTERQQAEAANLAAERRERNAVLVRISARIEAKGEQLTAFKRDEQRLGRLLQELERALADIPERELRRQPFKASRGALPWPLEGGVAARFGQARGIGDMRWSGLLIEAAAGSPVQAVSHGRVVYSDWLRGFGLLLIIDHGDGYMSLYGHNESLYKSAGDWVAAGEVVATVGASGGRSRPALYFEIRAAGRPVDPQAWLRPGEQTRG